MVSMCQQKEKENNLGEKRRWLGLQFHLKAWLGKDVLPQLCGYWQNSVSCILLTEGLISFWLLARSFSYVGLSPHITAHWIAICFIKASKRQSASKLEITILCNIITEVMFHYACYVLLVRINLEPHSINTQGREPHRMWKLGGRDN